MQKQIGLNLLKTEEDRNKYELHCNILLCTKFALEVCSTMGGIVRFEKKICPSHFWPFLDVTCDICQDMKDMMDMMTNERT